MKISSLQWKENKIVEYWNKRAQEVGPLTNAPTTQSYKRSEIRLFKKYFKKLNGKKLLKLDLWNEVNNTMILYWAAKKGAKVTGLDISTYLVEESKKRFKKAGLKGTFVHSDMRQMKLKDNSFDYIYTMGTIEHVPDYNLAIDEIYRVLKPGGTAIIGVPNKFDPFLRPLTVWLLELFDKYPYSPEKAFSFPELEAHTKQAGFINKDRTGVLFTPGILRMVDVFSYRLFPPISWLIGLLNKPLEYLENKYPFFARQGYLIAVVCEKPKKAKK